MEQFECIPVLCTIAEATNPATLSRGSGVSQGEGDSSGARGLLRRLCGFGERIRSGREPGLVRSSSVRERKRRRDKETPLENGEFARFSCEDAFFRARKMRKTPYLYLESFFPETVKLFFK